MILISDKPEVIIDISGKFHFYENGPVLLLDTDPIAYKAAHVMQTEIHIVKQKGSKTLKVEGGVTKLYARLGVENKKAFLALLADNPDMEYSKELRVDDSPEGLESMYDTICKNIQSVIHNTEAGSVELFLTDGASNFRITQELDVVLKYKGSRKADAKPKLLREARDFVMKLKGSLMCIGHEADDELSIRHWQYWHIAMDAAQLHYLGEDVTTQQIEEYAMTVVASVLGTIDKDIKMVPGRFINPDQDLGVEEIFPHGNLFMKGTDIKFCGLKGFYAQMLLGDSCDNIHKVYFCGDKRVFELLNDCETEEELFKAVLRETYEGHHRERIKSIMDSATDEDISNHLEALIKEGVEKKVTKASLTRAKKHFKDNLYESIPYQDKDFYHWSQYRVADDGTVTPACKLKRRAKLSQISPIDHMIGVARLVYMLKVYPNANNDHWWHPPEKKWVRTIQREYRLKNKGRSNG